MHEKVTDFEIGAFENWINRSEHIPILTKFNI